MNTDHALNWEWPITEAMVEDELASRKRMTKEKADRIIHERAELLRLTKALLACGGISVPMRHAQLMFEIRDFVARCEAK